MSFGGVFALNPFELLGEDDTGEGNVVIRPQVQLKKEEKAPVQLKPVKEEQKFRKAGDVTDNKESRHSDVRPERRAKDTQREDRKEDFSDSKVSPGAGSPGQERPYRPRGERAGSGDRRERRERDNVAAPGVSTRRVFDRRSGTGRGREEKRGGAGRGNWGSLNDEDSPVSVEKLEPPAPEEETGWNKPTEENAESWTAEVVSVEPVVEEKKEQSAEEIALQKEKEKEDKQMTLDEYLRSKKSLSYSLPEPRKAGEGEDAGQWDKFIAARSDKITEEDKIATSKQSASKDKAKVAKESAKVAADVLRFKSESQRRDRERRDRFRGSDQDGAMRRTNAPRTPVAKPAEFDATRDFPALKA